MKLLLPLPVTVTLSLSLSLPLRRPPCSSCGSTASPSCLPVHACSASLSPPPPRALTSPSRARGLHRASHGHCRPVPIQSESPVTKHNRPSTTWQRTPASSSPAHFLAVNAEHNLPTPFPHRRLSPPPRVTSLPRAAERTATTGNLAFRQRLSRSVDCRKSQRRATARGSLNEFPTQAILPCASLALPSLSFSHTLLTSYCLRFYRLLAAPPHPPRTSSALIPTSTHYAGHDTV